MKLSGILAFAAFAVMLTAYQGFGQVNQPKPLSPVAEAAKQVQTAEVGLKAAQATLQRAHDKVRDQYLTKPEWAGTKTDLTKAQTDTETMKKNALAAVRAKPEYLALIKQREDAQKVQDQANKSAVPGSDVEKVSDADLAAAQENYIKAGIQMKDMEKQALANDQAYNDAKARLDAANAKLAQLDAEVDDALKTDQDYQQLVQGVTQAQQQVDQAKQQLAQARQQMAQQAASASQSRTPPNSGRR